MTIHVLLRADDDAPTADDGTQTETTDTTDAPDTATAEETTD